jgi:hypothetical protein
MSVTTARATVLLTIFWWSLPVWAFAEGGPAKAPTHNCQRTKRSNLQLEREQDSEKHWHNFEKDWHDPGLPEPKDYKFIKSITVESRSCPFPGPDVGPFELPRKYYDEVLGYFRAAELDKSPNPADHELGTMKINYDVGNYDRICWFWNGGGARLAFSWRGVRYVIVGELFAGDEAMMFNGVTRLIHKKEVLHEKDVEIPRKSAYKPPNEKRKRGRNGEE